MQTQKYLAKKDIWAAASHIIAMSALIVSASVVAADYTPANTPALADFESDYSHQYYSCGIYVDRASYVKRGCVENYNKAELADARSITSDLKAGRFVCKQTKSSIFTIGVATQIRVEVQDGDRICLTKGQWNLASHDPLGGESILTALREKIVPADWAQQCRRRDANPLAYDQTMKLIQTSIKRSSTSEQITNWIKATIADVKSGSQADAFIYDMENSAGSIKSDCHAPEDVVQMAGELLKGFNKARDQ